MKKYNIISCLLFLLSVLQGHAQKEPQGYDFPHIDELQRSFDHEVTVVDEQKEGFKQVDEKDCTTLKKGTWKQSLQKWMREYKQCIVLGTICMIPFVVRIFFGDKVQLQELDKISDLEEARRSSLADCIVCDDFPKEENPHSIHYLGH